MTCRLLLLAILCLAPTLPARAEELSAKKDRVFKLFVEEFVLLTPGEGKFPGSFMMGGTDGPDSEKPATKVTLKKPFSMARYEVTQELYEAVMGKNPSRWPGPRNSVEKANWDDAIEFCRKATSGLQERKLIGADEIIRLPSEAEWEYACRAGTKTRYSFGDDPKQLGDYGWFNGNAQGNDPPVGKKRPNAWNLYDMHGYVWEWCADAWHPTLAEIPVDGAAQPARDAKERVLRGGAWSDDADKARSAYRHHKPADALSDAVGFRCVRAKK